MSDTKLVLSDIVPLDILPNNIAFFLSSSRLYAFGSNDYSDCSD